MNVDDIRRVLVVGAGTMGQQIAFQCAGHGLEVVVHDVSADARAALPVRIAAYADGLVAAGSISSTVRDRALGAISVAEDLAAAASEVDLVSESVPEDPGLKRRVFAALHPLCPARTIFTTNSSTLVPSQIAAATGRPDRFAAFHLHQPAWSSNVVDVMPHPGTAPETTAVLVAFARRIGQVPIQVRREQHGYVFNTMLTALNDAALTLAESGVASVEDIDRAWMGITKMPIGPLGILDLVGLDTSWHITDYWARRLIWRRQLRRNAAFLKRYVDSGALGVKAGRGFYRYPDPEFARSGFVEGPIEP